MVQTIYISLFMGVTKNCRDPAHDLYKQCAEASKLLKAKSEVESEFGVKLSLQLSSEVSVRSVSSIRQNDFVNYAGPIRINSWHRNFANTDRYVNKSRDKQTFKSNQESTIASLTPSLDLSVTF